MKNSSNFIEIRVNNLKENYVRVSARDGNEKPPETAFGINSRVDEGACSEQPSARLGQAANVF